MKKNTIILSALALLLSACGGDLSEPSEEGHGIDGRVADAAYSDVANLVNNSSFESGQATPWTAWNAFTVVSNNQHSGSYAAKLASSNCSAEQLISGLQPNTNYTLTGYAKVVTSGNKVYIGVKEFGGAETNQYTTSTSYKQLTVNFKTGPSSTSAKIYLWRDGAGSGGAYGDDFVLSAPSNPGDPGTANKAGVFWLHWNGTPMSDALIAKEAARRKLVVLNAWEHGSISKFKAANPNIKVLVYKDLSSTREYAVSGGVDDAYLPCGVGYVYANTQHPEWFLLDDSNNRLEYDGYDGHWQMDVGNAAYQSYWATQVVNELTAKGWDGAVFDNALIRADQYHDGVYPKKYKTDASIQEAYKAMLDVTKAKLDAAGKISIANLSNARTRLGTWNQYVDRLHGGFDEWWLVFDPNNRLPEYNEGWSAQVGEATYTESQQKISLVQPHSGADDNVGFYYAFASYWMANNGHTYFSEQKVFDGYGDPSPWRPEYDWDMGAPSGAYWTVSTGLYRRDFSKAIVIVNANASGTKTVNLGQSCLNEAGATVTSVTLGPTTGTVLRKL